MIGDLSLMLIITWFYQTAACFIHFIFFLFFFLQLYWAAADLHYYFITFLINFIDLAVLSLFPIPLLPFYLYLLVMSVINYIIDQVVDVYIYTYLYIA